MSAAKEPAQSARARDDLPTNPILERGADSAFQRLADLRERLRASGREFYDLTLGDPREITPAFIRKALIDAIPERSSYPTIAGRDSLRSAIAGWLTRRFAIALDPEREILPTNGSKEAIYHFASVVLGPESKKRKVVIPTPAYPVYARAAEMAGGETVWLPLEAERSYVADLDRIPGVVWDETALLWLNFPHNPTGAVVDEGFYRAAHTKAEHHGFVVASDEAYSEIYFGDPPPTALGAGCERTLVFQSLSKRSAMTGYRSGFVAGDRRLLQRYLRLRPNLGVATPEFVQVAAEAAWRDETHVETLRRRFAERRTHWTAFLRTQGMRWFDGGGTMFLWVEAPGRDDVEFAERCSERGVLLLPGSWLHPPASGWLRIALVELPADGEEVLARIASVVQTLP